ICLIDSLELEYIKTLSLFLNVYFEERIEDKLNFIELVHSQSSHPERHRLTNLLKSNLYDFSREKAEAVKRRCPQCASRTLLNTRPIVLPIRAFFIKKTYLFDLVDLRHYSEINEE
ncbi:hypothetical protein CDIK_4535, partial [Cucumispora dikerogammari]